RMGQAVLRLAAADPRVRVVAAVSEKVGQRVIQGVPQFNASELQGATAFDVAIDFSASSAFDAILAACVRSGAALVSGTTGLDPGQQARLATAGERIPVLWASNFSLGVAVLTALVDQAARALPGWDCDIVEVHHKGKQDAPSGTALSLGKAAEHGGARPRYASLRAGDIVGEHTVQFTTNGERIELVHRAFDRDVFARGALQAAQWLTGRRPGVYSLADILG
ncbi:MAG: dihydrodipicolinate reductase, partial [Xanthomonadaceae bacterium]|nr:dihydrodipicolinate reductase [Xanthomonadaceae bacterium]